MIITVGGRVVTGVGGGVDVVFVVGGGVDGAGVDGAGLVVVGAGDVDVGLNVGASVYPSGGQNSGTGG